MESENTLSLVDVLDSSKMITGCDCEKCGLNKDKLNPYIPGRLADPNSSLEEVKFILVGEAPGKQEDKLGYCFAGFSGENLKKAFKDKYSKVYLTNICRCTPYKDESHTKVRAPLKPEMSCCAPWIDREISLFPPEVPIILCGNTSLSHFFPDSKGVSVDAGFPLYKEINGVKRLFIANFHPASIGYSPKYTKRFYDVFDRIINNRIETEYSHDENTRILHPTSGIAYLDKLIALYKAGKIPYVIYDSETTSLSPNEGEIIMLGFCDPYTRKGITIPTVIQNNVNPGWHRPTVKIDMEISESDVLKLKAKTREFFSIVPIAGHNLKFDIKFAALHQYLDVNKVTVYQDTLSMMSVIKGRQWKGDSLSLKESANRLCGVELWDTEIDDYLELYTRVAERHYGQIPTCILYKYCGRDVYYNMLLLEVLYPLIEEHKCSLLLDNLNRCTEIFSQSELAGIEIDYNTFNLMKKSSDEAIAKFNKDIKQDPYIQAIMEERMKAELETNSKKLKKDGTPNRYWKDPAVFQQKFIDGEYFSLASPIDKKLLFKLYNIKATIETESGDIATSKEALEDIKFRYKDNANLVKFCDSVLQFNKFSKLKSTYIDGLYENVWERDKRLHVSFNINGTVTGRMSSYFHTMPRQSSVKRLFKSRWADKGGIFSGSDMSQLELRVTTAISGEQSWLQAYIDGKDLHQMTAAAMFHVPFDDVSKEQRTIGKVQNFSLLYGSGPKSQAQKLGITVSEAEEMLENYKSTIPRVMTLVKKQQVIAEANGFIWNMFRRYMPIPDAQSNDKGLKSHGLRQAFNYLIQSSSSEIVISGIVNFCKELKQRKMKSQLVGAVHDSVEFDIYPGEAIDFYNMMKYHFETELLERFSWLKCPMRIDIDMGTSWGSCIEMENPILLPDAIKFEGSGFKNDILALADQLRKAYNFDYRIMNKKELTDKDFTIVDLIRDTEKWEIKAILSRKK